MSDLRPAEEGIFCDMFLPNAASLTDQISFIMLLCKHSASLFISIFPSQDPFKKFSAFLRDRESIR